MNMPTLPISGAFAKLDIGRAQTIIAPAAAVVVSIIVLVFVIWPKFGQALTIRSENGQLTERLSLLSGKIQILESLDKNTLDQQLVAAERLLPSDKAVFAFVKQIENSASGSGVVLTKVDVAPGAISSPGNTLLPAASPAPGQSVVPTAGAAPAEAAAAKIQVKVALASDYKSLVNFMERVAALARISAIGDLTVASTSSIGESAPLRSTMVIDAYWRTLPSELGSIESPVEELTETEQEILDRVRQIAVSEPIVSQPSAAPPPSGRSDLFSPF